MNDDRNKLDDAITRTELGNYIIIYNIRKIKIYPKIYYFDDEQQKVTFLKILIYFNISINYSKDNSLFNMSIIKS